MDSNIIERLERIESKLDAVIKAMHDYDDNIYSGYDEPNDALLKAAGLYNEEINKKYGESSFEAFQLTNKYISSLNEEEMERRMDIIGQNGNEGLHYDMGVDDDTQDKDKRVVGKKGKRKFNGNKNKG